MDKRLKDVTRPVLSNGTDHRLTVGFAICRPKGRLLLVRSAKAAAEGFRAWWTLPQEGFEPEDGILATTIARGVREELCYALPQDCAKNAKFSGNMINSLLGDRDRKVSKEILFMGVETHAFTPRLNTAENVEVTYVSSWEMFERLMRQVSCHRVEKYLCTCNAVQRACRFGMLPGWIPGGSVRH